jgi:hypothetical protein
VTIQTATMKNTLASSYATAAAWMAAYTTTPGSSAGTEPTGGSPAYARKAPTWGSPSAGVVTATAVPLDIPASTTVVGVGFHSAVTAGTYLDGATVTSQTFASQGVYSVTPTFTEN